MGLLDGKVAIVTGAGQGVGRGIALALAAEGCSIAAAGRTFEKVEAVAVEIEARGVRALPILCDVGNKDEYPRANHTAGYQGAGAHRPDGSTKVAVFHYRFFMVIATPAACLLTKKVSLRPMVSSRRCRSIP